MEREDEAGKICLTQQFKIEQLIFVSSTQSMNGSLKGSRIIGKKVEVFFWRGVNCFMSLWMCVRISFDYMCLCIAVCFFIYIWGLLCTVMGHYTYILWILWVAPKVCSQHGSCFTCKVNKSKSWKARMRRILNPSLCSCFFSFESYFQNNFL